MYARCWLKNAGARSSKGFIVITGVEYPCTIPQYSSTGLLMVDAGAENTNSVNPHRLYYLRLSRRRNIYIATHTVVSTLPRRARQTCSFPMQQQQRKLLRGETTSSHPGDELSTTAFFSIVVVDAERPPFASPSALATTWRALDRLSKAQGPCIRVSLWSAASETNI